MSSPSEPSGAPLNPAVGLSGNPLRARIVEEIRRGGPIPFSRYMEMCLYEPELGYYARPREQFGKAGDFYTSSDVHAVFGRLLSRQLRRCGACWDRREIDLIGSARARLFAADVRLVGRESLHLRALCVTCWSSSRASANAIARAVANM